MKAWREASLCGRLNRNFERPLNSYRKASGYRQYTQDAVGRLRFIRRAKELGFSLKEIADALRFDPDTTFAEVKELAQAKLIDIEARTRLE
jgi:DNA-binding transcriptional MerR regulator